MRLMRIGGGMLVATGVICLLVPGFIGAGGAVLLALIGAAAIYLAGRP